MDDLGRLMDEITRWEGQAGGLLLMTDFDGTLAPLVSDAEAVRLAPEVQEDLAILARGPGSRLAVVSGRSLDDLRAHLGVPGAILAGCHGFEIAGGGVVFRHPGATARQLALETAACRAAHAAAAIPGLRVEHKRFALTLHTRHVPPEAREQVVALGRCLAADEGGPLRCLVGEHSVDVLPGVDWGKGACVEHVRRVVQPGLPTPCLGVFLGDDRSDEEAFEALPADSLTVRVGGDGHPTAARFRLASVGRAHWLIARLAGAVAGGTAT